MKTGESQRSNLTYQYRYRDIKNNLRYVYAPTLEELREKERTIQKDIDDGLDYCAGEVTVLTLIKRYIGLRKKSVRYNTTVGYNFVYNLVEKEDFGFRKIKSIKPSDAKQWFIKLHEDGRSYSTLTQIRGVLEPAFALAVEDDAIRNNPFSFRVVDVVANDSEKRKALNDKEVANLLEYIQSDKCRKRHYNEIIILLNTGLRISELCGLVMSDIDFEKNRIRVERQLARTRNCEYYIEKPKTESGMRFIPMNEVTVNAFRDVLKNRKHVPVEVMVDGCTGFIFLDKDGKPKVAGHLEHAMKRIVDHYNESHDVPIKATPHVLRHTFCTNLMRAGVPLKDVQYLMGHSDAGTTLNTYTHSSYADAEKSFKTAFNFG